MHCGHSILPLLLAAGLLAPCVLSQQNSPSAIESSSVAVAVLPEAPSPLQQGAAPVADQQTQKNGDYEGKQTRRILGIVPNFRSVGVDEKLPPISVHDKFKLMTDDNFDYSNFIYVGLLAGEGQLAGSYPEFHTGAPAYARYYWHIFADTIDGNLMTEFVVPAATKEDPRYYTLERGSIIKRSGYAMTRLLVTRTDQGHSTFNFAEIVGNGAASGISGLYYPSHERGWTKTGQRWETQVGLDGIANLAKEFWPDVNARIFHNKY